MSTGMKPGPNGRARTQLSDQIDRLDRILDGLAEALGEAVADAVQQAAGAAVRAALAETLAEPSIATALAERAAATQRPGFLARLRTAVTSAVVRMVAAANAHVVSARRATTAWLSRVRQAAWRIATGTLGRTATAASAAVTGAALAWRCRRAVGTSLLTGALTGVACYLAGPLAASAAGGLAAAALTLAARALTPIWHLGRCPVRSAV